MRFAGAFLSAVTAFQLGDELVNELNEYGQAKQELGRAIENRMMEVDAAAEQWWAANGANVTAEVDATKAWLEGIKGEVNSATAPHKAQAEADGMALKASLEAFADKAEQTFVANEGPLKNAFNTTVTEAEALGHLVEGSTLAEQDAVQNAGEALKASIEAAKAAENAVLESHRAEFEQAGAELEAGLTEAGEWLKAELEELEAEVDANVNVENLQAPHNVAMITLGDELKKELNEYEAAKEELGYAVEDKVDEVEDMIEEWWAINGDDVEAEVDATVAWLEGIEGEVNAATAPHKAQAEVDGMALKASLEAFGAKAEQTFVANEGPLKNAFNATVAEAEALGELVHESTVAERTAAENAGEALKASLEAAKAAETQVLESHRAEFEAFGAELEAGLTEAGAKLEAELKELGEDLETVEWADQTQLFGNGLSQVIPRPKYDLATTIAYSTAFVFLVAAFVAAALYTPKEKELKMTEVVVDVEAKPSKKQIKKSLKAIMKNNNTKTSLIQ